MRRKKIEEILRSHELIRQNILCPLPHELLGIEILEEVPRNTLTWGTHR